MSNAPDDFTSLFEFLPIGAYRSRPDGMMLRANPALVRLNGFASEAELLASVHDLAQQWYVQPGRRDEFRQQLERDGRVLAFESEIYRYKTRERIWISENAHLVRDAAGQVLFYEGTVEEITGRMRAQAALRDSEQALREITAKVPGVVYRMRLGADGKRRVDFVSDGVRTMLGVTPEELQADPDLMMRLRTPEDRQRLATELRQAAFAGLPLAAEFRVRLADGSEKWIQQTSSSVAPGDDALTRIGVLIDVSQRKNAEHELLANSELWKRALEGSGDGVWDWHVQDGVEVLSPQCKALYGFAPGELPDTPDALDSRTHPDDLPAMRQAREAHFAGQTPTYVNEHRVRCKDGSWKWILSRGMLLARDAQGRPLRMIGTHTDITARKQAEALRAERDLAAAADRAKSQFMSRVSHELRTPLNAVLGFSQLLEMQLGGQPRELAWVQQILGSGRQLLALMDDILDLSSAQTGQLPMHPEALDLRPVAEEAWTMLAGSAFEAGLHFIDELPPGSSGLAVRADRKRLKQILSNLLGNAIKYNRRGGWVRVQAQTLGEEVELSVSDSGPGLSAAQQARLFQPFERAGAQSGPVSGTGLGLALSRQLAEAMGGSLGVESSPGAGARFYLRLARA